MTGHSKPLLDCRDGYRAELEEREDGSLWLFIRQYLGGKEYGISHPVLRSGDPQTWRQKASIRRHYYLVQAICRFINAGGELSELNDACEDAADYFTQRPEVKPAGELLDVLEESRRQMLILEPGDTVLVVEEDSWAERVPLETLAGRIPGIPVEPVSDQFPKL